MPIHFGLGPLAIPAIAMGISALTKGITGARQRAQAKQIRPGEVSDQTKLATTIAGQQAQATQMPGMEQIQDQIAQSTGQAVANAQKAGTSSSDVLNVASAADKAAKQMMTSLGTENAMFRNRAQLNYQNQLMAEGAEAVQNKRIADEMKANLQAAGTQNIISGVGDVANFGMAAGMGLFDGGASPMGPMPYSGAAGSGPALPPMGVNAMGPPFGITRPNFNLNAQPSLYPIG